MNVVCGFSSALIVIPHKLVKKNLSDLGFNSSLLLLSATGLPVQQTLECENSTLCIIHSNFTTGVCPQSLPPLPLYPRLLPRSLQLSHIGIWQIWCSHNKLDVNNIKMPKKWQRNVERFKFFGVHISADLTLDYKHLPSGEEDPTEALLL